MEEFTLCPRAQSRERRLVPNVTDLMMDPWILKIFGRSLASPSSWISCGLLWRVQYSTMFQLYNSSTLDKEAQKRSMAIFSS
ncbi:hypothetical protein EVAR_46398_1 [Eumeta japonica]|uniref:Uncharacterized protein n=1 Tax=Eumeta variegata TaxID=151549 RepID=A0A4C1WUV4_EUMVA|nr:hypothetical protein EVAR_46398_1 [Eumeta japonica]